MRALFRRRCLDRNLRDLLLEAGHYECQHRVPRLGARRRMRHHRRPVHRLVERDGYGKRRRRGRRKEKGR